MTPRLRYGILAAALAGIGVISIAAWRHHQSELPTVSAYTGTPQTYGPNEAYGSNANLNGQSSAYANGQTGYANGQTYTNETASNYASGYNSANQNANQPAYTSTYPSNYNSYSTDRYRSETSRGTAYAPPPACGDCPQTAYAAPPYPASGSYDETYYRENFNAPPPPPPAGYVSEHDRVVYESHPRVEEHYVTRTHYVERSNRVYYRGHHHRSKKKTALIVAGTAGTGAVIGALAGGGKGAGIGALAGGAAGYLYTKFRH